MTPESVTVVTINRNNAAGLRQTIESVICQQPYQPRMVVIDGASTDDSVSVIQHYEQHLSYWVSEPDRGIYHAQNKGIAKATGDYILFLNSGDTLASPNSLWQLAQKAGPADIVYGDLLLSDGIHPPERYDFEDHPDAEFWKHHTLSHNAALIRTSLLRVLGGYDESVKLCADWKFFITARFKYNASFLHVPEAITVYNTSGISSQTENLEQMKQEHRQVWKELFPSPGLLKRLLMKLHLLRRIP